jgi:isoleucyl-tRNA synthetase
MLIKGEPCYKNVICLGLILDAKGDKMSKARGNVVDPWTVLNKSGADALRWYLYTSSPPGNVRRFSADMVGEVLRSFILTLWNTYSFFVMYANIDNFDPKSVSNPELSDLDVWILSSLNQLIADVDSLLENYDPTTAGRKIESFVGDLSNWYVRRSRRRFWKSQNDTDKIAAYSTLYTCLVTLTKLLAPFMPFIAEEMYRNLVCSIDDSAPESVHLTDFPAADMSLVDDELNDTTRLVMMVCSLGRAARSKAAVKVRQPLAKAIIKLRSQSEIERLQKLSSQIIEELNVKSIEFTHTDDCTAMDGFAVMTEGDYSVCVDTRVSGDLEIEGMAR